MTTVAGGIADRQHPPLATDAPVLDDPVITALRAREFARLDEHDQVYLDHTGGGLYAASQIAEHHAVLRDTRPGESALVGPGVPDLDGGRGGGPAGHPGVPGRLV